MGVVVVVLLVSGSGTLLSNCEVSPRTGAGGVVSGGFQETWGEGDGDRRGRFHASDAEGFQP